MRWVIASVVAFVIAAASAGAYFLNVYLVTPRGGAASAVVKVGRGETLRHVLDDAERQGVLHHATWLYSYARLRHLTSVRTGTYELRAEQTPLTQLQVLLEGRVMLEAFTVAEGLNRWQVRALLAQEGWLTASQFDALCDDLAFLKQNDLPGPSCEGYLFPSTYKFARGVAPAQIMQTMFAEFHRELAQVSASHGWGPLALPKRQFVTLASIVEKETGQPAERPHIACVFYNRLIAKPAWRMETDPTVIYAALLSDPHFDGNITRAHLRTLESPYNTYRVFGLPPGPIASPGRAALEAVAAPIACKDFFFVSRNNGQHIFCPTLGCHNAAVQQFQVDYFRGKRSHAR